MEKEDVKQEFKEYASSIATFVCKYSILQMFLP